MMITQDFNRRHSPNRRKTRVEASMTLDGAVHPIWVVDVCFRGMKLQVPLDIPKGSPVTISVLDQRIPAIVHWSRSGFAGVHLLRRLDGRALIALESAEDDLADFR